MQPPFPAIYATGGDGFSPPVEGGSEAVMYFEFTKANTTAATRAFTLFPGATIVGMSVFIITAFDGGTTLSVGHTGSNTYYLNADSVLGSTGPNYSTAWAHLYAKLTAAENITFTLNGSPTVGDAILAVRYIMQ